MDRKVTMLFRFAIVGYLAMYTTLDTKGPELTLTSFKTTSEP